MTGERRRFRRDQTLGWPLERKVRFYVVRRRRHQCWNWRGPTDRYGYGALMVHRKNWKAHRAAWTAWKGPIPKGMWILHKCDNRRCCNPAHLYAGTPRDNVRDMMTRKRQRFLAGAERPNAKFSPGEVRAIRRDRRIQRIIAAERGVSQSIISDVKRGHSYRNVL